MSDASALIKLAGKLGSLNRLDAEDRAAILALPHRMRTYDPAAYLVREGQPPGKHCSFIIAGFAFRQKQTAQGTRQIVSINMAGDLLDLQQLFLKISDHNIQALTRLETAELDRAALRALARERPAVGEAMWIDAMIEASIFREWALNVGRRDARARIAHLLCEFATRMKAAGIATDGRYELPMTQEQIGDATGLTGVHVNRTLRSLAADGLIHRDRRFLGFADWDRVRAAADFSALYLHLDQSAPEG
ncbi:Crp/Fnr family transcriptional regulator [Sphingomonas bacterium]|uniref:Crp/Fnr family transcriptional regulator n=1 Tax=Sphingomonas bacterium TaxID=1895847 RepID=UPI0015755223|nr:Crp/Fnr family transcriptional regulator [Sphingomonas bacterium]